MGYTGGIMVAHRTNPETHSAARRPSRSKRPRAARTPAIPKRKPGEEVHDYLVRLGNSIPEEELANFPIDGAANHDHYIYGAPKQY